MDDTLELTTSPREPLRSPSPTRKHPRNGTAVKFTLLVLLFQSVLVVLFMILTDYGEHSLPPQRVSVQTKVFGNNTTETEVLEGQKIEANDITLYYPSK